MQNVRIVEIPKCKMVSSGTGMFGEEKFGRFFQWFAGQPKTIYPKDFLYHNGEGFVWLYLYDESLTPPKEFEIVDFEGGLYSVATDIDQQTNIEEMDRQVNDFLDKNGFERDDRRYRMGNIITSSLANEILGYHQMDYYSPIKKKTR